MRPSTGSHVALSAPSLYPLFADLRGRRVLIVGGGAAAARKAEALLAAGAQICVCAPQLTPALRALAAARRIEHRPGQFEAAWIQGATLVIAATRDATIDRTVADAARACGLFVNVVDDAALSNVHMPARVRRGTLQIAISSGGAAPMLVRWLRERLEAQLDESLAALTDLLARQRQRIRQHLPELSMRRRWFDRLLAGPLGASLRRGDHEAAERELAHALATGTAAPLRGTVALVGAGPGDPGLLTLRALRVLNEADVILYDRLVSAEVLALARREAQRIDVGKRAGSGGTPQRRINALLIRYARAGRRVVRLKGGDPFVFGRGGEELATLRAHNIPYEVVPGITAAIACAAYAGIPLTHRHHAQSLRLVTAHCKDSLDAIDWCALAQDRQTLAVYMAIASLDRWAEQLLAHGRSASTPFALIENGTRLQQRVVTGPLGELVARARAHGVRSPALLVVGDVARYADTLHWFAAAPLGAAVKLEEAA